MTAIYMVPASMGVGLPGWFLGFALVGMCLALSALRAEFRTPRVRAVLAAVVLAVVLSANSAAVLVLDPCGQVSGWVYVVIGCWL